MGLTVDECQMAESALEDWLTGGVVTSSVDDGACICATDTCM